MNQSLLSSETMSWQTPDNLLAIIREFNQGPIGLDPCTTADNPCGANVFYTPEIDGLRCGWDGHGLVYCNPPYSRHLVEWARAMREEAASGSEIIGLVPARTDTRWFQNILTADVICFWTGRLRFRGAPASAPFPSALPYWGPRIARFRDVFSSHGWFR